jgi:hypothetical protein
MNSGGYDTRRYSFFQNLLSGEQALFSALPKEAGLAQI